MGTTHKNLSSLNKRGIILPIVLGLIMLVVLSAMLISGFGTNTRRLLIGAQGANLARLAADSAINEAKAFCLSQTALSPTDWEPFFQGLLPNPKNKPEEFEFIPSVTTKSFSALGVTLSKVKVKKLHLTTIHSRAQGLVSLVVEAKWQDKKLTRRVTRTLYQPYTPRRRKRPHQNKAQMTIRFLPGHLCAGEEGESS